MFVAKVLSSKAQSGVRTITPDATVADAAADLAANRIGALVVCTDEICPAGILSERDIVRELGRQGAAVLSEKVGDVMTVKLQTCGPSDDVESVLTRMTDGRFRHMPVMDGDTMIGIVTLGDVVKARLSEVSMEKDALEAMISGHG